MGKGGSIRRLMTVHTGSRFVCINNASLRRQLGSCRNVQIAQTNHVTVDKIISLSCLWCIVIVSFHDYHIHIIVIVVNGQRISCPPGSWYTHHHALSQYSSLTETSLLVLDGHIGASGRLVLATDEVADLFVFGLLDGGLVVLSTLAHELLLDEVDTWHTQLARVREL